MIDLLFLHPASHLAVAFIDLSPPPPPFYSGGVKIYVLSLIYPFGFIGENIGFIGENICLIAYLPIWFYFIARACSPLLARYPDYVLQHK